MATGSIFADKMAQARRDLERLCKMVNNPSPGTEADVEWFKEWLPYWRASKSLDVALPSFEMLVALQGQVEAIIWPRISSRGARLEAYVRRRSKNPRLELIARLVTNDLHELFGGPCLRCKRCFVKVRGERQECCSRACRSALTAIAATNTRHKKLRGKKLQFVREAQREYAQKGRSEKREKWVAWRATELMHEQRDLLTDREIIKPNFVTLNFTNNKGKKGAR